MSPEAKPRPLNILVVDDHESSREALQEVIEREGHRPLVAKLGQEAIDHLDTDAVDIVLTDLRLPDRDGLEILRHVQQHLPDVPVVLITGHGTVDTAVSAMKMGAQDYLTKPIKLNEISRALKSAERVRRLYIENLALHDELEKTKTFSKMIGASTRMRAVFDTIQQVARTDATVLIEGDNGTGKELVARAIHDLSSRRGGAYVVVNCAAIPPALLESELFGHERGAFTGAVRQKKGQFEAANGGTLFLDEIGEMALEAQSKLLRVLETHELRRVGATALIKTDLRLISATNADLKARIGQGRFRQDLFFRINVVHMQLPLLRERPEDIPLLVHHFLKEFREPAGKIKPIGADALRAMAAYDWPGNVRELRNAIEHAVVTCTGEMIGLENMPDTIRPLPSDLPAAPTVSPDATLEQVEQAHIAAMLQAHGGNKTRTAKALGIGLKTLYRKIAKYNLANPATGGAGQ